MRLEKRFVLGIRGDPSAGPAFHQYLDGAIGQLQQLQDRGDGADQINIIGFGIVLGRIFLRHKQDLLVFPHDVFKRQHGFFTAHEQRHDHMWKNHNVPQR